MNISLDELDRALTKDGATAFANRSPRAGGPDGIGVSVAIHYNRFKGPYIVSVEKYVDDGGYGQKLSRHELARETLVAVLAEARVHGFGVEDFALS